MGSRGAYTRRSPIVPLTGDPQSPRDDGPRGRAPARDADPGDAISLHHVLATWRHLERQLERLVTDDGRADTRARIADLGVLYRSMVGGAAVSHATLTDDQDTIERAREVVRRHLPQGSPGHASRRR